MMRRTDQLRPGDRVRVPSLYLEAVTVAEVIDSGYVNRHDLPILNVLYAGEPVNRWGHVGRGNSALAETLWDVVPVEPAVTP